MQYRRDCNRERQRGRKRKLLFSKELYRGKGGEKQREKQWESIEIVRKKRQYTQTNCFIVFPLQLMIDSQSTSMDMMDHKNDGKAKRWSHLRIVRVVVPSGKSAGEGEKKKSRERRDVRWKQCQLRAECIDYSENENHPLMSSAVQAATWHMQTYQAGADRPKKKKNARFPPLTMSQCYTSRTRPRGFLSQQI